MAKLKEIYRCEECGVEKPCIIVRVGTDGDLPSNCPFSGVLCKWNLMTNC